MKSSGSDYRHESQRPTLTPLFACGLTLWIGCALCYGIFPPLSLNDSLAFGIAGLISGGILCALALMRFRNLIVFSCAFLLIGCALGLAAAYSLQTISNDVAQTNLIEATVTLLEDSSNNGFGENALIEVHSKDNKSIRAKGQFGKIEPLYYGEHLNVKGIFKQINLKSDSYLWQQGCAGTLKIAQFERVENNPLIDILTKLRIRTINLFNNNEESSQVLRAMVCGYRSDLSSTEIYSSYQSCGLAHLVAVSGAHLVIVTSLIAALLKRLRCPRVASIMLLVIIMISYLIFSAAPLSAIRATVMSSVGILSLLGKRRPSSMNALGMALILVVLVNPQASIAVSFTLSILATTGIVLFCPLITSWFRRLPINRFPFIVDTISLTLASSLLAQLYACSIFSLLPLISPLANLICAPFFSTICSLGLLGALASALNIPFADFIIQMALFLATIMNDAIELMSHVPYSAIPFTCATVQALLITALIAFMLWVIWPPLKQFLPIAAVALTCFAASWIVIPAADTITMFNVGQGDSFLIRSRGKTLLVDTGNNDRQLLTSLANNHILALDGVLITHADDDHCGSLDALKSKVSIDTIFLAEDTWNCVGSNAQDLLDQSNVITNNVIPLSKEDKISIGSFTARVIWPDEFRDEGGNGDSLCVLLEYDGNNDGVIDAKAFMCGDAEKDELAAMISNNDLGKVDILKVGHHGSKNAFTPDEIQVLSPSIAFIGVGENNRYGHPSSEALEALQDVHASIFRSDQDGEVTCTLKPDSISVRSTG